MARIIRQLSELKELRSEIEAAQRKQKEERALAAQLARQRAKAASEFHEAVRDVTPIAQSTRATLGSPPPTPLALQTMRDEEAALAESRFTDFDSTTLLDTDAELSWCRPGMSPDVVRKLRRGNWTIQDELDLHGARRDEARELLALFLRESLKQGLRCVRIIHGKGLGSVDKIPILKDKVRQWLTQKNEVIAFCQARANEGGSGALVVLLQARGRPGA